MSKQFILTHNLATFDTFYKNHLVLLTFFSFWFPSHPFGYYFSASFIGFLASAHSLNADVSLFVLGTLHTIPGWLCPCPDFSYFSNKLMTSKHFIPLELPTLNHWLYIHQAPQIHMPKTELIIFLPAHSSSYFPLSRLSQKPRAPKCFPSPPLSSSQSPRPVDPCSGISH